MSSALVFLLMSFVGIGIPMVMAYVYCNVAEATDERTLLKQLVKLYSLPKGTTQQEALRVADEQQTRLAKASAN
jgi:hypothetical protein